MEKLKLGDERSVIVGKFTVLLFTVCVPAVQIHLSIGLQALGLYEMSD